MRLQRKYKYALDGNVAIARLVVNSMSGMLHWLVIMRLEAERIAVIRE